MKKIYLFTMLCIVSALGLRAQTDVTAQYITNAGFDVESDFQTENVATGDSNQRKDVTGWTNSGGNTYTTGAVIGFGTAGKINGADLPPTNADNGTTGGALALNAAWTSQVWYAQEVTLPAGNYTMKFMVNNVGNNGNFEKDPPLFTFTTDQNSFSGNVHNYPQDSWIEQTISFALATQTTGTIKIGYKATNIGSGNTPKLVVDYVKAFYNSNYTETLKSTIDRATILNARASDSDLASAISVAQNVLNGADNTIAYQATIDSAVETLRTAISTAAAKVVLLEGENITFMLENADFESSTPVSVGITTYDYDAAQNGTHFSRMQVVEGWTIGANGNAKSAGVYEFGTNPFLGSVGKQYQAPATGSATGESKALGLVAVWSSTVQYKQPVTLPEGSYIVEVPVYNTAGTTAFSKNLIGFVESNNTEHLATATKYDIGKWNTEKVFFELTEETEGYFSLGYQAANAGSGAMPHLFIDNIKVTYTSPIAAAKQRYDEVLEQAQAAIANEEYENVTGSEKATLEEEIAKAEPTTKDGYNTAADALQEKTEAFTAAKASYDTFAAAKAIATPTPDLAYATAAKKTAVNTAKNATPTTAEDADTKAAAITTALRAYYESHAAAENVSGAVDMTSAIANPDAMNGNNDWTWDGSKNNPRNNEPWTDADGNASHWYFDGGAWGDNSWNTTMEQNVTIPAGKYLLTVKARAAANVTFTMEAGSQSVDLPHIGADLGTGVFDRGWNDASVEFETTESGNVTIKVTASTSTQYEWFSISDFRLVRLELYTEKATANDYAALKAAITSAETHTLGFDVNEYAPYKNVEAIEALAAAKAINQDIDNVKDDVTNATQTLTSATWTANGNAELDAIYDGQFANTEANATSGDITLPGWTKVQGIRLLVKDEETDPGLANTDGGAAVFSWGGTTLTYGEQAGYTLPLNKDELYELTLKVSGWRDGDLPDYVSASLDGEGESVNAQALGAKAINTSEGNPFASLTFYLKPTADNSILTIYGNHHFTIADLSLKMVTSGDANKLGDIVNSVLGKRQNYSGKSGELSDVTKFVNKYLK